MKPGLQWFTESATLVIKPFSLSKSCKSVMSLRESSVLLIWSDFCQTLS